MFIGIDMSTRGQARAGKTIAAVSESTKRGIKLLFLEALLDDQSLLSFLNRESFIVCGIDAPLSLPPCILCHSPNCIECSLAFFVKELGFDVEDLYHYRLSDLLIRKCLKGVSPKAPLSKGGPVDITPLTLRWLHLSRKLTKKKKLSNGYISEVYASGTIELYAQKFGLSIGKKFYYRASQEKRALFLCFLAEEGLLIANETILENLISSEDAFDAAIACLSGWLLYHQQSLEPAELLGLKKERASRFVSPVMSVKRTLRERMLIDLRSSPRPALPSFPSLPDNLAHIIHKPSTVT